MMSDSIDILDAKIINVGIDFEIKATKHSNKTFVLSEVKQRLLSDMSETKPEIGEPISLSEIYSSIMKVDNVLEVLDIKIFPISNDGYSAYRYNVESNFNSDGNQILVPYNTIWEIKHSKDILGTIR